MANNYRKNAKKADTTKLFHNENNLRIITNFKGGDQMTKSTQNVLGKVDWFQAVLHQVSYQTVFQDLLKISLESVSIQAGSLKHEEYDIVYTCGFLKYYTYHQPEKAKERGTLVLSGQACTTYEWIMLSYNPKVNVFQELATRFYEYASQTAFTFEIKRLDLALDDYNEVPYFTVEQLHNKVKRKQFLSKGRSYQLHDSEFNAKQRAKTVSIGVRGSACMFRAYDKAKEMAKDFDGAKQEEILARAPQIRLEVETRNDVAESLFRTIAFLPQDQCVANLIRGFLQTELTFYTDGSLKQVCRWWQDYLKPSLVPTITRQYQVSSFDRSLNWYEYGGPMALTQALFFLHHEGVGIDPSLLEIRPNYEWTPELSDRMIQYVSEQQRPDLIPLIQERTKKASVTSQ